MNQTDRANPARPPRRLRAHNRFRQPWRNNPCSLITDSGLSLNLKPMTPPSSRHQRHARGMHTTRHSRKSRLFARMIALPPTGATLQTPLPPSAPWHGPRCAFNFRPVTGKGSAIGGRRDFPERRSSAPDEHSMASARDLRRERTNNGCPDDPRVLSNSKSDGHLRATVINRPFQPY
jgi:hypothetical protein